MKLHVQNLHIHLSPTSNVETRAMHRPYSAAVHATKALPRLGQVWDEQRGIFLGLVAGPRDYALILPVSKDADLGRHAWGEMGKSIPGADSNTDGLANTRAMADAGNTLATRIVEMVVDGFSELYMFSRHEARLAFLFAAAHFDKDSWHLTSTQSSPHNAWLQYFVDGHQGTTIKDYEGVVRARPQIIHLIL